MTINSSHPTSITIPGYAPGNWTVDRERSQISFSIRQMISKVRGRFTVFNVAIVTGDDSLASSVSATIELDSLDTGNAKRDEHIRSDTFFDTANFPRATYRSTGVRRTNDGWSLDGVLTMHGTSQKVALALAAPTFERTADGGRQIRITATANLSRGAFGIDHWTGGGLLVSDSARIQLDIRAVQQ
jgi:polyisoprenoid-binding protein YceI